MEFDTKNKEIEIIIGTITIGLIIAGKIEIAGIIILIKILTIILEKAMIKTGILEKEKRLGKPIWKETEPAKPAENKPK